MVLHSGRIYSSNRFQLFRAEINNDQSLIHFINQCLPEYLVPELKKSRVSQKEYLKDTIDLCLVVRIFKAEMAILGQE